MRRLSLVAGGSSLLLHLGLVTLLFNRGFTPNIVPVDPGLRVSIENPFVTAARLAAESATPLDQVAPSELQPAAPVVPPSPAAVEERHPVAAAEAPAVTAMATTPPEPAEAEGAKAPPALLAGPPTASPPATAIAAGEAAPAVPPPAPPSPPFVAATAAPLVDAARIAAPPPDPPSAEPKPAPAVPTPDAMASEAQEASPLPSSGVLAPAPQTVTPPTVAASTVAPPTVAGQTAIPVPGAVAPPEAAPIFSPNAPHFPVEPLQASSTPASAAPRISASTLVAAVAPPSSIVPPRVSVPTPQAPQPPTSATIPVASAPLPSPSPPTAVVAAPPTPPPASPPTIAAAKVVDEGSPVSPAPAVSPLQSTTAVAPEMSGAPEAAPAEAPSVPTGPAAGTKDVSVATLEAPHAMADMLRFIDRYDGGTCFALSPTEITADTARIDSFSDSDDRIHAFDAAFRAATGIDAHVTGQRVTKLQCPVVDFIRQTRGNDATSPVLTIDQTSLRSGDLLSGSVRGVGGRSVTLLLISETGEIDDLTADVRDQGTTKRFSTALRHALPNRVVPQVLLAIASDAPLPPSRLPSSVADNRLRSLVEDSARSHVSLQTTGKLFLLTR